MADWRDSVSNNAKRRIQWTTPWAALIVMALVLGITAMWLYWLLLGIAAAGHIVLAELERRQK